MDIKVPSLDINLFIQGNPEEKKQFCQDIGKSFNETGFVIIKNHTLSTELRENLYDHVKKVFALPEEVKSKYDLPEIANQRGYTGKGKEKAKDANTPDLKEFWQLGQVIDGSDEIEKEYPENVILEELPDFNTISREVFSKQEEIGTYVLRAIALYLGLDEFYFDSKIKKGNSILRMIHYFPLHNVDAIPDDAVRAAAHEDINLITLLMGASADGLELLTKEGKWLAINAKENELVINVGDMLQRLTNNLLRSTTHRVINPPKHLLGTSRYSIPFFFHPRSDMDLTCLPSCITSDVPKAYEDITAGEYLDQRLAEIGLKPATM